MTTGCKSKRRTHSDSTASGYDPVREWKNTTDYWGAYGYITSEGKRPTRPVIYGLNGEPSYLDAKAEKIFTTYVSDLYQAGI